MTWFKNGTPHILTEDGSTLEITDMKPTKFNFMMRHYFRVGGVQTELRIDDISTTTYNRRTQANGGTSATQAVEDGLAITHNSVDDDEFTVMYAFNIADREKLFMIHEMAREGAGSGESPERTLFYCKQQGTTNAYTKLSTNNFIGGSVDFAPDTNLSILGTD